MSAAVERARFAPALGVADAVLYEGYLLFPYTASTRKNRVRWQFGVVVPQAYAATGSESSEAQTEVLLESAGGVTVNVLVRFLHVEARRVEALIEGQYEPVETLRVGEREYVTFDEAVEREIEVRVHVAGDGAERAPIVFPAQTREEPVLDASGAVVGRVVRECWALEGCVAVSWIPIALERPVHRLRVGIENHSEVVAGERAGALRTAFVSTHTLLAAEGTGRFLSVLDPPAYAVETAAGLKSRNAFPVLAGDASADSQRASLVLSSPIILYDFPATAKQTTVEAFDATEVDELIKLSVLSLSDAERAEAKATDPRARAIVESAERFGADDLTALHGILDIPSIDCVFVDGVKVSKGSKVVLHPKRRADVWDTFLEGMAATVRAVHQDLEGEFYVAVTVDDDPATELHEWYGRSLFFYPDEIAV